MAENDKRIQLRENVHQLVVNWSSRRGVTPSAFASMVLYEYMRASPEWSDTSTIQPPRATQKKVSSIFESTPAPGVIDVSPERREELFAEWDDGTADDDDPSHDG